MGILIFNVTFADKQIHISEFPASLKRLMLKDCSVKVGNLVKSIFHTIEMQLVELEVRETSFLKDIN